MKQQILKILNPIHNLTTDDKWKIAEILTADLSSREYTDKLQFYFEVDQWLERLTQQAITKEQLICDEPEHHKNCNGGDGDCDWCFDKSKVLIDGLEKKKTNPKYLLIGCNGMTLFIDNGGTVFELSVDRGNLNSRVVNNATLQDLITEIDRYNRTAKEKIELNWTENALKGLK